MSLLKHINAGRGPVDYKLATGDAETHRVHLNGVRLIANSVLNRRHNRDVV